MKRMLVFLLGALFSTLVVAQESVPDTTTLSTASSNSTPNSAKNYTPVVPTKDYLLYKVIPFMAGKISKNQIKIFYFFNYTNESSYQMFEFLKQYDKASSPIKIVFTPIYFNQYQVTSARIALTLNELSLGGIQESLYDAILNKKIDPDNLNQVADFVVNAQHYVSKDRFIKTYNGETITNDMQLMPLIVKNFGIGALPAISLNGAFYTDFGLANASQARFKMIFLAMLQDYYNMIKN